MSDGDSGGGGGRTAAIVAAVGLLPSTVLFSVVLFAFGIGGTASPAGACPGGIAVPPSVDLNPSTIEGVNGLKSMYEQVGQEKELSWALLAAVDYRENNNDPNRSALSGEPIGSTNPDSGAVTSSKLDSLQRAADHVKAMASSVYGVALTAASGGDDVKNALLAYNRGYIYQRAGASADVSPYVMNQADDAHRDMRWPDVAGEPLAGQVEYGRYGAFVIFARLGGSTVGGCGGLSDDELVRIAQQQIGLKEVPDGCNCGEEIQKFLGSSPGEFWCADFVSWVYREANKPFTGGHDGGWRVSWVPAMHDWLVQNGEWQDRGGGDPPRPGDVITFRDDDHVGIVERVEGTTVHTIEGNTANQVGRRTYGGAEGAYSTEIVGWGRMKGATAA